MEDFIIKIAQKAPHLCFVLLLVSTILGIYKFTKLNTSLKIITVFIAASLIIDCVSRVYLFILDSPNTFLFPILSVLEFTLISAYYLAVADPKLKKFILKLQVVLGVIFIGLAFQALNAESQEALTIKSGYLKTAVHLIIIGYALHIMTNQISQEKAKPITFGLLIYYAGSSIIFLLLPVFIYTEYSTSYIIWMINALLMATFYFTCFLELWRWKKN